MVEFFQLLGWGESNGQKRDEPVGRRRASRAATLGAVSAAPDAPVARSEAEGFPVGSPNIKSSTRQQRYA